MKKYILDLTVRETVAVGKQEFKVKGRGGNNGENTNNWEDLFVIQRHQKGRSSSSSSGV